MYFCQKLLDPLSCPITKLRHRENAFDSEGTASHIASLCVMSGDKDAFHKKNAPGSLIRSVRPLPMRLVTVRKSLDSGAQSFVNEYMSKVNRYCSFQELQIRPNPKNTRQVSIVVNMLANQNSVDEQTLKAGSTNKGVMLKCDVVAQVEAEGERVLKTIASKDWVILLDERGRDVTSEQLATAIAEAGDTSASALVFCIGGPYGHGSQVRKRANVSIKLSSMTLNHQVAMIVLLEQIYRSWTILRGEKYHH